MKRVSIKELGTGWNYQDLRGNITLIMIQKRENLHQCNESVFLEFPSLLLPDLTTKMKSNHAQAFATGEWLQGNNVYHKHFSMIDHGNTRLQVNRAVFLFSSSFQYQT